MIVIPAIDLKQGQCVRLKQGRMEEATVFSDDPLTMAGHWHSQGARRLHIVDLDGAFAGQPVNGDIVKSIARTFPDLPLQIGGGIRDLAAIETYLSAGVSFVIIGTRAVEEPAFVARACQDFPERIIVGLDARNGLVATRGWASTSSVSAVELAKQFSGYGVQAIVYTDIARDGMMQGINVQATVALAEQTDVPVIASGGISSMDDIRALKSVCRTATGAGIIGAITGRAIYEGSLDIKAAQHFLDE
ncbi:MAG: 1-(5-phosphoribosyl)-5-[(5-phosphoribosylamino)methylideneamino]imidazole-4-carboxamide isomerase [Pseudohongiellaceae bacterium]